MTRSDRNYTDIHNDPKCNKDIVICPKCGHKGHYTRHLNIAKNRLIDLFNLNEYTRFHYFHTIMHACFTENKAEGRNNWCYFKEDSVGREGVYITVKLKNDENQLPDFILDRQRDAELEEAESKKNEEKNFEDANFHGWESEGDDPYFDNDTYNQDGFQDD